MNAIASRQATPRTQIARGADDFNVTKILLTGGPCAGKTSALSEIQNDLTQQNYKVVMVPEAASLLAKGGAMIDATKFNPGEGLAFQKILMNLQISLEETYSDIARMVDDQHVVMLIDRGLCDGSAYVSKEDWQAVMDDLNMNTITMRENRYDGVLHLVTAADGAEKFYQGDNVRSEGLEMARQLDRRLEKAYKGMGHKYWTRIDNSHPDGFKGKMAMAKQQVQRILGKGYGRTFYQKHLLKKNSNGKVQKKSGDERNQARDALPIDLPPNQQYELSEVTEIFIDYNHNDGELKEASIEKRGINDTFTYALKLQIEKNGQLIKKKRNISATEFVALRAHKKEGMSELNSQRIYLQEDDVNIIIDYYPDVEDQPVLAVFLVNSELLTSENDAVRRSVKLPDYLKIDREVTNVLDYMSMGLAARIKKAENTV